MFNKSINSSRQYFDAEVVRHMKNSMMVAIDASYKVGKWMMGHGDQKIYEALHSGLNEYGEVVMQRWSTSDNHGELEAHLRQLQKLGFKPWWIFSDVPEKDKDMLVRVFKNLMVVVDKDHSERVEETLAPASNLQLIPADMDNCSHICNSTNAETSLHQINELIDSRESINKKVIYYDSGEYR